MPATRLPDGRLHYVNPFSMLCDRCEQRIPCDWIEDRCRYECTDCQRDWQSEEAFALEVAATMTEAAE